MVFARKCGYTHSVQGGTPSEYILTFEENHENKDGPCGARRGHTLENPSPRASAGSRALLAWVKVPACKNTILPNFGVSWGCVSCVFQQDVRAKIDANPSAPRPAAALAFLMSNRDNHHLAGRAKQRTRPAAAFCCPGEFGAHSGWVCELARSSARSTPREGAKHKKPGGRWSAAGRSLRAAAARWAAAARRLLTARGAGGRWSAATGRTPATTRKRQASKNDARHPKQRAHLLDTCKCTISGFSSVWIRPFIGVAHMVWLLFAVVQD